MRFAITILLCFVSLAATASPAYPLKTKTGAKYLVDQNNVPFFFQGDAPWELMENLNGTDVETYLANRAAKGYNTIICEAIEHQFSTSPPNNAYGQGPFTNTVDGSHWDFNTTNPRYWTNVDAVISRAGFYGIQVVLFPAYFGFGGGNEGWWGDLGFNTLTTLTNYGKFIGNRYMNYTNIIYSLGGDFVATNMNIPDAIAYGILSVDSNHLITAHSSRKLSGFQGYPRPWLTLNTTYSGFFSYTNAAIDYTNTTLPSFLIEEYYENETANDLPSTPTVTGQMLREQEWWAVLSGNMGFTMGNNPLWFLNDGSSGWQAQMDSIGSRTSTNIYQFLRTRPWYNLVPDTNNSILTAGFGTKGDTNWVTCARDTNSETVICYIPRGPAHTLTIDMSKVGKWHAKAYWLNPSNMAATVIGYYDSVGSKNFTQPDTGDWLLWFDSVTPGFTTPGDLGTLPSERYVPFIPGYNLGLRLQTPGATPVFNTVFTNVYATNGAAWINAAIQSCPSNQVVFFADTGSNNVYDFHTTVLNATKNGVILRGASATNTFLFGHAFAGATPNGDLGFPITNTLTLGATNMLISNTTNLNGNIAAGDMLRICALMPTTNEDWQIMSVAGYRDEPSWTVIVDAVSGNSINFWPPLPSGIWTNNAIAIPCNSTGVGSTRPKSGIGFENFTFMNTNIFTGVDDTSPYTFTITGLKESWFTNVNVYYYNSAILNMDNASMIDINGCTFRYNKGAGGSSKEGVLLGHNTGVFLENCIMADLGVIGQEYNQGFSGCVTFGCFATNNTTLPNANGDLLSHNTNPFYDYWEQCKMPSKMKCDGYFGSVSYQVYYKCETFGSVDWKRFITYNTMEGCVVGSVNGTTPLYLQPTNHFITFPVLNLGFPNIGNNDYTWTNPYPYFFSWPGAPTSDGFTNGMFTFTNTFGPTNQFWSYMGVGTFDNIPAPAGSIYALKLQDTLGPNTNIYYPDAATNVITFNEGVVQILSTAAGTISNLNISRSITVSNGLKLWIAGQNSFQGYNPTNYWTHLIHGNMFRTNSPTFTGTLVWDPLVENRNLMTSLTFTNGPPPYWGTNRWPSIDATLTPAVTPIPAELRYVGINSSIPATPASSMTIGLSTTLRQTTGTRLILQ